MMESGSAPQVNFKDIWEQRNLSVKLESYAHGESQSLAFLKNLANFPQYASCDALEIGCGSGAWVTKLCQYFRSVTAVDISPLALKLYAEQKNPNLKLVQNNGRDLCEIPDASIDIIFSMNLFHWLNAEQVAGYLADAHRILKKNGEFILNVVTQKCPSRNVSNTFVYSLQSYIEAALNAGFMVRECNNDETLPTGLGLGRTSIELVRCDRGPRPLNEIQSALVSFSATQSTRVLEIDEIESWNLIEQACHAYQAKDRKTFNDSLSAISKQHLSLSRDLFLAVESLMSLNIDAAKTMAANPFQIDPQRLTSKYREYFGLGSGGVNLLEALSATEPTALNRFRSLVSQTVAKRGRIFCIGNGGSFDNARLIAKTLGALGCIARIPGSGDSFFEGDYSQSFKNALISEKLTASDFVIGLSGSGNSPNIVEAFSYALSLGAAVFALGGRDGGQMRKVVGDGASLIAKSSCMEAIEDIHYAVGLVVAESIAWEEEPLTTLGRFTESIRTSLTDQTIEGFTILANELLRTIKENATVYVVGSGVGANHFRADAQRGFTNGVPLRGICAPELFTTNSGMATANDDGSDYLLIDGLAKFRASAGDFALLMDFPGQGNRISLARSWLTSRGTPFITLGPRGSNIDFSPFIENFNAEFVGSLAAHSTGVVMREILWEKWRVRELVGIEKTLNLSDQRKLSFSNAQFLRNQLVQDKVIGEHETITFCYGKVFAALDPRQFGLEYGYY